MTREKTALRRAQMPFKPLTIPLICLLAALTGCDKASISDADFEVVSWQPGVFEAATSFAHQCENPRSGIDPSTDQPYVDRRGSGLLERHFLRSWSNETYLWYDEIHDRDPALYGTRDYFDLLRTREQTPSGNDKDNFHFSMPSEKWHSLSQSGVSLGYGATWSMLNSRPPREMVVAYVEPGSPAEAANLTRGARILAIDGADFVYGDDIDTLNAGLSPSTEGESHDFRVRDLDGSERTVSLSATNVASTPVTGVRTLANGEVGYILFNDHIATAEAGLIDAIGELEAEGVHDLVLDLRYNGGGYLAIASQLAYMIAGPARTGGQPFETLAFNDKHPDTNPVTGQALSPTPFYDQSLGLSAPQGQALPSLNLDRVFVLTGPNTCSASESIINGLRGVDVEVIQIGTTTCGKPYGYYPQDNCGQTYFTIQFRGENAKGFGDYADGFSPQNAVSAGEPIPGCDVADDYQHALGDPAEARLAAALHYRESPNNPCSSYTTYGQSKPSSLSAVDGRVLKSPALQGRVMKE